MTFTIEEQIKCVEREIGKRKHFYPQWMMNGKIKPEVAEKEVKTMMAVLETLKGVQAQQSPTLFNEGDKI